MLNAIFASKVTCQINDRLSDTLKVMANHYQK